MKRLFLSSLLGLVLLLSPQALANLGLPTQVVVDSGRERLLSVTDQRTLAAIETQVPQNSDYLYYCVASWTEQPELTGTVAQAGQAVAWLVASPEFGAQSVLEVMAHLPPSSAQSFLIGLAGTAEMPEPGALLRARDALTALTAPLEECPVDHLVAQSLVDISSLAELHGLRILELSRLPNRKREGVRRARLSVPNPNPGQTLQKIIRLSDLERFLTGEFKPAVGGSVAFYDQVAFLKTPAELIAGLRLDYPGGFQNEQRVGALVFPRPSELLLKIPFGESLGGLPPAEFVYPFTGSGFTASVRARLIPELTVISLERQPLPPGTRAYEIDEAGVRHLRGVLNQENKWVSAGQDHQAR